VDSSLLHAVVEESPDAPAPVQWESFTEWGLMGGGKAFFSSFAISMSTARLVSGTGHVASLAAALFLRHFAGGISTFLNQRLTSWLTSSVSSTSLTGYPSSMHLSQAVNQVWGLGEGKGVGLAHMWLRGAGILWYDGVD